MALAPLAEAVADRYFAEFPDDLARYGDAARAGRSTTRCTACTGRSSTSRAAPTSSARSRGWRASCAREASRSSAWARNLELAADVVAEGVAAPGAAVADRLRAAAAGLP